MLVLPAALTVALAFPTAPALAAAHRPHPVAQARPGASPLARAISYLESRQGSGGGFAEPGRAPDPGLTAWAVLGLRAAGVQAQEAVGYLAGKPYPGATDLELRILALDALGRDVSALAGALAGLTRPSGQIGPALNSTIWGVIALRSAGLSVPTKTVRFLRRAQAANGGWGWASGVAPDADDTAAAVQALRAVGVAPGSTPVRRALAFLRRLQNPDGGFESAAGRGSNAQSTAWAIQAFLAAGASPGASAFAYLRGLQRADGSFRLSRRYVTTPVWVTSQVVAALARKSFPLR